MTVLPIIAGISGTPPTYFTTVVPGTVVDDGYYNGFPFPFQLSDGRLISIYKKSADHASKGPMMLAVSYNGGSSWSESQITIGATPIECAALSVGVLDSGRILIGYQDNTLYTSLKFAYSDNKGGTWTASASVLTNGTGLSFSPIKMIIFPSGKVWCGYYTGYGALEDAEIGFCESTNDGVTWSFSTSIFVHDGSGFGNDKGYEFACAIIEDTGVDATCYLIAIVRNADQEADMFYKSADGGTTWVTDLVTEDDPGDFSRHYFYRWNGRGNSQSPCDIVLFNNEVYVIKGVRDTNVGEDFALEYTKASVANAKINNYFGWSAPVSIFVTGQNDVHFGYPLGMKAKDTEAGVENLWCQLYDVSPLATNGLGSPRCLVQQVLIDTP